MATTRHRLDQALAYQKAGQIEAAESLYLEILDTHPNNADALHYLGVLRYQQHDYVEAEAHLEKALRLNTGNPTFHYHMAFLLRDTNRIREAIDAFKQAVSLKPRFFDAQFNLGVLLERTGDLSVAEDHFRKAILSAPTQIKSYNRLGKLLWRRGHTTDAEETEACFRMAAKLGPNAIEGNLNLADYFYFRQKPNEAATHYRKVLQIDPNNPTAQHMLQNIEGRDQAAVEVDFATRHFTPYTNHMENALKGRLDFRTPEKLRRMVGDILNQQWEISDIETPVGGLDILDLGCGVGLNGPLYRGIAQKLVGCDLSDQLLEQAKNKDLYDSLTHQGAVNYLGRGEKLFDLILAQDILIYIGALEGIFAGVSKRSQPAGLFAFAIEKQAGRDFTMGDNGRFSHDPQYILDLCQQNAFTPLIQHDTILRKNQSGYDIEGSLFVIQKNTTTQKSTHL